MKRWDVQGYSFVTDIGQFVKHADYVQVETTLHNWIDKAGGYRCRIDQLESERDTLRAELAEVQEKALRFDLDQAGIEQREREVVELVTLRAELAVARSELAVSVGHLSRLAEAYGCEDFTAAVDAALAAKGE